MRVSYNKSIAFIALLSILLIVNYSIYEKEQHLKNGKVVYIELAPVDPRSLMQGDYMALRFKISNELRKHLQNNAINTESKYRLKSMDGFLVATLDANNVATFKTLYEQQTLADNEILIQYRVRDNKIKFATNAYFFQEGHAEVYEPARYGQFRVNTKGEPLLVAMYDEDLNKLEFNTADSLTKQ